jgi:hypothetical protein
MGKESGNHNIIYSILHVTYGGRFSQTAFFIQYDRSFMSQSLNFTCTVSILRAGGTKFDAQHVLRHASSSTTQNYTESINEELRLKNPAENLIEA